MRPPLVSLLALALAACGGSIGAADGKVGNDSRTFSETGFDRVVLAGPDDVSINIGPAFAVRAQGYNEVLERLELSVQDGELRVDRKRDGESWGRRGKAKISVTMPQIRGATLSGAGRLDIDRAEAPAFEGAISGAGDYRVGQLKAQTASFRLSGAGNLDIAGEVGTLDLSLSGAGNVSADKLTARDLSAEIGGVGNVDARATGAATGRVSGVGSITVRGTDNCNIRKSGVGSVTCKP